MKVVQMVVAALLSSLASASAVIQPRDWPAYQFRIELSSMGGKKSGIIEIPNGYRDVKIHSDILVSWLYMDFQGFSKPKDPGLMGRCSFWSPEKKFLGWAGFDEATSKSIDSLDLGRPPDERQVPSIVGWVGCNTYRVPVS